MRGSVRGDRRKPAPYRDELQLANWSRKRRVVVMRRRLPPKEVALPAQAAEGDQLLLGLPERLIHFVQNSLTSCSYGLLFHDIL